MKEEEPVSQAPNLSDEFDVHLNTSANGHTEDLGDHFSKTDPFPLLEFQIAIYTNDLFVRYCSN